MQRQLHAFWRDRVADDGTCSLHTPQFSIWPSQPLGFGDTGRPIEMSQLSQPVFALHAQSYNCKLVPGGRDVRGDYVR